MVSWLTNRYFSKLKSIEAASQEGGQDDSARVEAILDQEMKQRPMVDQEVWVTNEGGMRDVLLAGVKAKLKSEDIGQAMAKETALLGSSWGFELGDLEIERGRLVMWHGTVDNNVPLRMAKESVEILGERAELIIYEGEGHLSLIRKADEIMARLKAMMG